MRLRRVIGVIGLVILLAACSTEAEPFFPTLRPTLTNAPPPTALPITITPTDPPTITLPTDSPITAPAVSDQSTLSGSSANALLSGINGQPIAPGGLDIEYFTTDAQSATAGGTLTLYWSIGGTDHGVIYRLTPTGSHDQFWQIGRSGTLQVTVSQTATDQARYELQINNAVTHLEKVISVPIGCTQAGSQTAWAFSPAPSSCPAAAAISSPAAQQGFEHGQMLWIGLSGQIYVLFDDRKSPGWAVYPDQFKDGMPDHDPSISPPAGKSQPVRGFGLVWRSQTGVRARLGWAIASETEYDGFSQSDNQSAPNTTLYILTRDHQIAQLSGNRTWSLIPATLATPAPTPKH